MTRSSRAPRTFTRWARSCTSSSSGRRPHPGDSHNAILHHIGTQPAVPLARAQPGLPDALTASVNRALSSDLRRTSGLSVEAFAQELAPFAKREVWPSPKVEDSGPTRLAVTSTLLAPGDRARPTPPVSSVAGVTADDHAPAPAPPPPARPRLRALLALGSGAAVVALVALVGVGSRRSTVASRRIG